MSSSMSMNAFAEMAKKYKAEDKTKWAVVIPAPFTASGLTEIVGRFRTKKEAELFRGVAPIGSTLTLRIEDLKM